MAAAQSSLGPWRWKDAKDELLMNSLFEGEPIKVDLAALMDGAGDTHARSLMLGGSNARSLMARAGTLSAATTTAATSEAAPSVANDSSVSGGEANIYVIGNTGDDTEDSLSAGILPRRSALTSRRATSGAARTSTASTQPLAPRTSGRPLRWSTTRHAHSHASRAWTSSAGGG